MPLINPEYRPSKINRPIVLSPACNHPHNKFFSKNNDGAGWMLTYSKYIKWFDTYVADNYKNWLTGKEMYTLRCNLLHQGTANLQKHKYSRIVFQEPNQYRYVDNMVIGDILIINVETFCSHIINGIIEWYNSAEHSPEFLRNYSKMIRRHPDGLSPMISDVPVIC